METRWGRGEYVWAAAIRRYWVTCHYCVSVVTRLCSMERHFVGRALRGKEDGGGPAPFGCKRDHYNLLGGRCAGLSSIEAQRILFLPETNAPFASNRRSVGFRWPRS